MQTLTQLKGFFVQHLLYLSQLLPVLFHSLTELVVGDSAKGGVLVQRSAVGCSDLGCRRRACLACASGEYLDGIFFFNNTLMIKY